MRTLVSALILFLVAMPWSTVIGSGLESAARLVDRCHSYMSDPATPAGKLCVAYMQGFMAGARSRGWLLRSDAAQMRGAHGVGSPVCVADTLAMPALIEQLIGYSVLRKDLNSLSALSLVEDMFAEKYPCRINK